MPRKGLRENNVVENNVPEEEKDWINEIDEYPDEDSQFQYKEDDNTPVVSWSIYGKDLITLHGFNSTIEQNIIISMFKAVYADPNNNDLAKACGHAFDMMFDNLDKETGTVLDRNDAYRVALSELEKCESTYAKRAVTLINSELERTKEEEHTIAKEREKAKQEEEARLREEEEERLREEEEERLREEEKEKERLESIKRYEEVQAQIKKSQEERDAKEKELIATYQKREIDENLVKMPIESNSRVPGSPLLVAGEYDDNFTTTRQRNLFRSFILATIEEPNPELVKEFSNALSEIKYESGYLKYDTNGNHARNIAEMAYFVLVKSNTQKAKDALILAEQELGRDKILTDNELSKLEEDYNNELSIYLESARKYDIYCSLRKQAKELYDSADNVISKIREKTEKNGFWNGRYAKSYNDLETAAPDQKDFQYRYFAHIAESDPQKAVSDLGKQLTNITDEIKELHKKAQKYDVTNMNIRGDNTYSDDSFKRDHDKILKMQTILQRERAKKGIIGNNYNAVDNWMLSDLNNYKRIHDKLSNNTLAVCGKLGFLAEDLKTIPDNFKKVQDSLKKYNELGKDAKLSEIEKAYDELKTNVDNFISEKENPKLSGTEKSYLKKAKEYIVSLQANINDAAAMKSYTSWNADSSYNEMAESSYTKTIDSSNEHINAMISDEANTALTKFNERANIARLYLTRLMDLGGNREDNSPQFNAMKIALQNVTALKENSTVNEINEAYGRLLSASDVYIEKIGVKGGGHNHLTGKKGAKRLSLAKELKNFCVDTSRNPIMGAYIDTNKSIAGQKRNSMLLDDNIIIVPNDDNSSVMNEKGVKKSNLKKLMEQNHIEERKSTVSRKSIHININDKETIHELTSSKK